MKIIFLSGLIFTFGFSQGFAENSYAKRVRTTHVFQNGIQVKWEVPEIALSSSIFQQAKNPKIQIRLPHHHDDIFIHAQTLYVDFEREELILKGNVVARFGHHIVETQFLHLEFKDPFMRTSDPFVFKQKGRTFKGKGLLVDLKTKQVHLLYVQNQKQAHLVIPWKEKT
ncbi:MAG: LPS export ABC transporter periplasmic protein LptC [Deltaproteobacteria bacterium]|nr:LPS export ABC transporter periplasmic protein LptC [Deltaproteobacteria bacterium]